MTTKEEQALITKYDLLFESRLSKLEENNIAFNNTLKDFKEIFKEIKSDLRWMLGLLLGFMGVILGLMAKGFHWY